MTNNFEKSLNKKIYGGLLKTPKERQKFSFGATFGYIDPKLLPDEYSVGEPLDIKDQGNAFTCVAFSLTSVSEDQERVILDPSFTIKTISEIIGDPNWVYVGTSLENGAKSSLKGALERTESPFTVEKDDLGVITNPKNWNTTYNDLAMKHAKQAWFWIGTSGGSMFDKIRSAIYTFKDKKNSVQTGVMWNNEWTSKIYIDKEGTPAGGHAIKIFAWKGNYLKIQNSIGKEIGENGCQWIHKNLVDKLFTFGALMLTDMPENLTEEEIKKKSELYRASWIGKIGIYIIRFFKWLIGDIFK